MVFLASILILVLGSTQAIDLTRLYDRQYKRELVGKLAHYDYMAL